MRQAGNAPGSIRAKLTSIYKSNTDWKKELRRIVGKSISRDNYRRAFANKNALASQDRLARTDKTNYDALGSIVVAVDTSGSMSMEEFKIIIGELYALALQIKPMNLVVIQFDADVQSVDVYHGLADLKRLKKLIRMPRSLCAALWASRQWLLKQFRPVPVTLLLSRSRQIVFWRLSVKQ